MGHACVTVIPTVLHTVSGLTSDQKAIAEEAANEKAIEEEARQLWMDQAGEMTGFGGRLTVDHVHTLSPFTFCRSAPDNSCCPIMIHQHSVSVCLAHTTDS